MKRLIVLGSVLLLVAINAYYNGKIADFLGSMLYQWQTGETMEEYKAREQFKEGLEARYRGVKACPALEDFAQSVERESVDRRGTWAEVLIKNVRADSNREFVTAYLAAFQKLAFKDSREFDEELHWIVHQYCNDDRTTRRNDHATTRPRDHATKKEESNRNTDYRTMDQQD
jgi:hypothetical protein